MSRETTKSRNPFAAFLFSLLVPGLGQVYNGQVGKGLLIFVASQSLLLIMGFTPVLKYFYGLVLCIMVYAGFLIYVLADAVKGARKGNDPLSRRYLPWYFCLLAGVVILAFFWVFGSPFFPVRGFTIPTVALAPTVMEGDRVIADMEAFKNENPDYGDIVLFEQDGATWAFRVVGLPGDSIVLNSGLVTVNGASQNRFIREKLVSGKTLNEFEEALPDGEAYRIQVPGEASGVDTAAVKRILVPGGAYFLLGDNRGNALDSRYIGPVTEDRILGRILYSYFGRSPDRINVDFRIR